jgi:glucose uptake protein GlcU
MGALIMFGLVIVIANVGGIYFLMQDKKAHQIKK